MNKKEALLSPEGFKELYDYLEQDKLDEEVKVDEIQSYLKEKYGYSEGKITGIIKRAKDNEMIINIKWGIYKLNKSYINGEENNGFNVIKRIDDEISTTIERIEKIISQSFSILNTNEIIKIKDKIERLERIINN